MKKIYEMLETPCILIDMEKARHNIRIMQETADRNNCALRPHIKTHKSVEFARLQVDMGAKGITCAKVSEAEVMAAGGLDDIFIAYPLVGSFRVARALALNKKIKRLILAVDSLESAKALSEAAVSSGTVFEVRLEVDTGAKRTGVLMEQAAVLASEIAALPGLKLTGIYTFKSLVYKGSPTTDNREAGNEEGRLMEKISQTIRAMGVHITDISAGSTPTGSSVADTGKVTEIRPGTYIFQDYMTYCEGVCSYDEIAAYIIATVVSTPHPEYAVIDGGTKTFPADVNINVPPYNYPGYAIVDGNDDLMLSRLNEEHGILTSRSGNTGLKVGQKLKLIPVHICTSVNLQNHVYVYDNGELRKITVDARGMLV